MSWEAVKWANDQRLRLPQEQLLLLLLANAADPDGVAFRWWQKREHWWTYLVARSRQSRASIFRHMNTLEKIGLAAREEVVSDDGEIRFLVRLDLKAAFDVEADDAGQDEPQSHGETQSQSHGETEQVSPVRLSQSHSCDYKESPSESNIERETRACEVKRPSIKRWLLGWPTAGIDDKSKTTKAWDALTDEDCEAALAGITPFLAELKKHGRKHIPAGWKYLEDQSWKLIEWAVDVAPGHLKFDCWSRDWWVLLLAKVDRREATAFMVKYASEPGRHEWGSTSAEMPTAERISEFKNYPSDGPVMAAWRPWFESKGVKLPQWQQRVWVFLPSTDPPNTS